jgi:hypothetical protein
MTSSTVGGIVLAMAVTLAGVVACSSDPAATTASSGLLVKASVGGTISDPNGRATLTIPPGALEKDTDIVLKVLPASGGSLTPVYDFGPDGTTFKIAAKLELKAESIVAPAGKALAVGIASGGSFQPVEGSTVQNGVATAPVTHFTGFAVIAVGGGDAGTDAGGDCAFKGSFTLEKYVCGTTDVTAQWKGLVPTDAVVVTDKAGGGCTLKLTHTGPNCVEAETFEATLTSGSSYQLKHLGITACTPAACKFTTDDPACMVGDRVKTETVMIVAEGAKFHIKRTSEAGDLCGGEAEDVTFAP